MGNGDRWWDIYSERVSVTIYVAMLLVISFNNTGTLSTSLHLVCRKSASSPHTCSSFHIHSPLHTQTASSTADQNWTWRSLPVHHCSGTHLNWEMREVAYIPIVSMRLWPRFYGAGRNSGYLTRWVVNDDRLSDVTDCWLRILGGTCTFAIDYLCWLFVSLILGI